MRILNESRDRGTTIVFSSHVLSEIEETCDRVVILRAGVLVHDQDLSALDDQHRITANIRHVRADNVEIPGGLTGRASLSLDDGRLSLDCEGDLAPAIKWLATLDVVDVKIRPVGLGAVYDRFHGSDDES